MISETLVRQIRFNTESIILCYSFLLFFATLLVLLPFSKLKRFCKHFVKASSLVFLGISGLYFCYCFFFYILSNFDIDNNVYGTTEDLNSFYDRLTGPYIFPMVIMLFKPLVFLVIALLLRLKKIRSFYITWWLCSLVLLIFAIPYERLIILVTTFHRDYSPSSWSHNTSSGQDWSIFYLILYNYLFLTFIFLMLTLMVSYFIKRKTTQGTIEDLGESD